MPVAWCLADPKIGERGVAAELLAHASRTGALRTGLILIADKDAAQRRHPAPAPNGESARLSASALTTNVYRV